MAERMSAPGREGFDAQRKEEELRAEAEAWDTDDPVAAEPGDIPVVDVGPYFETGTTERLERAADSLREACEEVGFLFLLGHGVDRGLVETTFEQARRFHALPDATKATVLMDEPDQPVRGVGWLPLGERKLPRRSKGNLNEAFLVKLDRHITMDENRWPDEAALPGFRAAVEDHIATMDRLAIQLLPVYARALELEPDFFASAFTHPVRRFRLSHYPAVQTPPEGTFGIAPHVDTTFFTLLAQDGPGLVIQDARSNRWIEVPVIEGALVVNTGELLKQWSNDRFLSTRHFAVNPSGGQSRYSLPYFFNANADHRMVCLPTCCSDDNPPRHPPVSYRESQAAVQGE